MVCHTTYALSEATYIYNCDRANLTTGVIWMTRIHILKIYLRVLFSIHIKSNGVQDRVHLWCIRSIVQIQQLLQAPVLWTFLNSWSPFTRFVVLFIRILDFVLLKLFFAQIHNLKYILIKVYIINIWETQWYVKFTQDVKVMDTSVFLRLNISAPL